MICKKFTLIIFFCATLVSIAAFEWPVSEIIPSSVFGQKKQDSIECGIVLEKTDIIRAAGNGTILMTLDETKTNFPCALGNTVIIAHDEGLVTVYGNLATLDRLDQRTIVETGTILGQAGASACTEEKNTLFQILDQTRQLYINPLLLLPAQIDTRSPDIKEVTLLSGNGKEYPLKNLRIIRQGKYRLYANILDTVNTVPNALAPFRVTILLNGSEYTSIPFEIITGTSGFLRLGSTKQGINHLYNEQGFLDLGEISFTRGKNNLSIIARDITGNERVQSWSITAE